MALIPPIFLDAVVAVGFAGQDGKAHYQATGLIYAQKQIDKNGKGYRVFIVTNRHVFVGKTKGFMSISTMKKMRFRSKPVRDESGKHIKPLVRISRVSL